MSPAVDSIVTYLIDASATDFHKHQPPSPVAFRNVELRKLIGSNSEDIYLICGEFLAKEKQTKDEWTPFVTIKTSGYEQWLGTSALGYRKESVAVVYSAQDFSTELKSRFESLSTPVASQQ